jgi:sugar O-acyltransferase (sialic acid O-acetyltransferase NeuD family)
MKKPLVIFGPGDFGQVASRYFAQDSPYELVAFTADRQHITESTVLGSEVIPFDELERHYPPSSCELFVAIGYSRLNRARREVFDRCKKKGYRLASYFCSRACNFGPVEIGENSFVLEANVIQPFVSIGKNVILWSGNHVGHHTTIEDDCYLASHVTIAGRVRIGRGTFVGVNATIIDRVTIGAENIIGAGTLITGNTRDKEVYRGMRSRPADTTSDKLWG